MTKSRPRWLWPATILSSVFFVPAAFAQDGDPIETVINALAPDITKETLAQIPKVSRKLLALRSYLRSRSKLEERWSWTAEEIRNFQGSPKQKALLEEVEAIRAHFAQANPGYEIYANTKVRSLDKQIRNWNRNKSLVDGERTRNARRHPGAVKP